MKFDAATAMESLASESFTYQTLVPFEGSTVTGVAMDGVYVSGTKLTATAVGNGMDNVNPVEGDSRWIPRTDVYKRQILMLSLMWATVIRPIPAVICGKTQI